MKQTKKERAQKFLWTDESGLPRQLVPGRPAPGGRVSIYDVEVRLQLPTGDLDALTDRLMETLMSIGAQDVTMGGSLATGEFEVSVAVEALDLSTAQHGGLADIGEALEAAGAEAELRSIRVRRRPEERTYSRST